MARYTLLTSLAMARSPAPRSGSVVRMFSEVLKPHWLRNRGAFELVPIPTALAMPEAGPDPEERPWPQEAGPPEMGLVLSAMPRSRIIRCSSTIVGLR